MFSRPLRRDPLVVAWAVLLLLAALVALDHDTTWSGHLEPSRVLGFLRDLAEAFLWSFAALHLLAWLRDRPGARLRRRRGRAGAARTPVRGARGRRGGRGAGGRTQAGPGGPPWTDRWLRDWRELDAERRDGLVDGASPSGLPVTCRHGVLVDGADHPPGQAPVLRALAVSHAIVRPGSGVSVSWCFEHCLDVVVDGRGGHPACGQALVPVQRSRRIEVVGRNRHGSTPAATPSVVAMAVPQRDLPGVGAPPAVTLRTDVGAVVGAASPITARLDDFWATQERLRPAPPPVPMTLIGFPTPPLVRRRPGPHRTEDAGQ